MKLHGNNCAMNSDPPPEGDQSTEQMIAKLGVCASLSERDHIAIAFAIRCAYGLGFEDGRDSKRAAA